MWFRRTQSCRAISLNPKTDPSRAASLQAALRDVHPDDAVTGSDELRQVVLAVLGQTRLVNQVDVHVCSFPTRRGGARRRWRLAYLEP